MLAFNVINAFLIATAAVYLLALIYIFWLGKYVSIAWNRILIIVNHEDTKVFLTVVAAGLFMGAIAAIRGVWG